MDSRAVPPFSLEADAERRVSIAFLNWAHALDHFVMLIFPTVVIGLELVYARPYSELIVLSTASFVAFGVCSLPAGWLADHWSRRNMMVLFYFGCGASLVGAAFAPNLVMLALALFVLGVFAAIYHPVGMAMLIEASKARGRTLAFNGVCGNLGAALAAGITAVLASTLSWRGAFLVPAGLCIVTGAAYLWLVADDGRHVGTRKSVPEVALPRALAILMLVLFIIVALAAGITFNTMSVSLPKIVDERLGKDVPLVVVGGLATAVFLCGALAQLAVGRLVERIAPQRLGDRPLYRRPLARAHLCGALFPDLRLLRRGGRRDRVPAQPRRLCAGARRDRGHCARLLGRDRRDRRAGIRRRAPAHAGYRGGGVTSGTGRVGKGAERAVPTDFPRWATGPTHL